MYRVCFQVVAIKQYGNASAQVYWRTTLQHYCEVFPQTYEFKDEIEQQPLSAATE
jgi:hypothetical protein